MIWIDSSFAIPWLLGDPMTRRVSLGEEARGVLPAQYGEVLVYFGKRLEDLTVVVAQLESLSLGQLEKGEIEMAAQLFVKARLEARQKKSKASLADAMLAAVSRQRHETVLSFDHDFISLGLTQSQPGLWSPPH